MIAPTIPLTSAQVEAACAALTKDGATFEILPGVSLRLAVDRDEDATINDYECYGTTSKYAYRYWGPEGRTPRPEGFDGAACKIQVDRGLWVWWQPVAELKSRRAWVRAGEPAETWAAAFAEHQRLAEQLLTEGFYVVTVELVATCDLGHRHAVDANSVHGVDTDDPAHVASVARDLLFDLEGLELPR